MVCMIVLEEKKTLSSVFGKFPSVFMGFSGVFRFEIYTVVKPIKYMLNQLLGNDLSIRWFEHLEIFYLCLFCNYPIKACTLFFDGYRFKILLNCLCAQKKTYSPLNLELYNLMDESLYVTPQLMKVHNHFCYFELGAFYHWL